LSQSKDFGKQKKMGKGKWGKGKWEVSCLPLTSDVLVVDLSVTAQFSRGFLPLMFYVYHFLL